MTDYQCCAKDERKHSIMEDTYRGQKQYVISFFSLSFLSLHLLCSYYLLLYLSFTVHVSYYCRMQHGPAGLTLQFFLQVP